MAKSFSSAMQDLLNAGSVDFRYLVKVSLDSGDYFFGNHTPGEDLTWAGEDWYGLGGLLKVGELRTRNGLAADEAKISIDGTMLLDTPEGYESASQWLRDILREDLVNRRLEIHELYQDPSTGEPVGSILQFAGPIDGAPLNLKRPELAIRVRSNRQALGWPTGRTRSDADQQRIASNDRSLRHAAKVAASEGMLPWGYVPSHSGASVSTGSGGTGGTTVSPRRFLQ